MIKNRILIQIKSIKMKNHTKKILITRFDIVKRFSYATTISVNFCSLIINKRNRYIETLKQVMDT